MKIFNLIKIIFGCIKIPRSSTKYLVREPIVNDEIFVCIHEWGGYEGSRIKNVKHVIPFQCGLKYQIDRFLLEQKKLNVDITITMSDQNLYPNIDSIKKICNHFIPVDNQGMDFSGYNAFYQRIKDYPNSYIILTNSSVNSEITTFLESYIDFMNLNPDVGILGVSTSSRYYHTVLKWNYNPHLQSFFLLTSIDVLSKIVDLNNGVFPGINEVNKHLLIRSGEVRLSLLALELGYKLAVVNEYGVFKFDKENYPLPRGDFRNITKHPNQIFPIK